MRITPKHLFYEELYALMNSHEALREAIWSLCATVDYVMLDSPRDKALVRLGVIEQYLGETEQTQRLRALAVTLWPPTIRAASSHSET